MFFEELKKKFAVMQYPTQLGNARVQVGAAPVNKGGKVYCMFKLLIKNEILTLHTVSSPLHCLSLPQVLLTDPDTAL